MEIKECKSSEFIRNEIKSILEGIKNKIQVNYKNKLVVRGGYYGYDLAQSEEPIIKFLGITVERHTNYEDVIQAIFNDRKLEVTMYDVSEFLYPIVKDEFTKFAEENKDSIKMLCFIKDF